MNPKKFSKVIQKIHEAFYGDKLKIVSETEHEVQLKFKDELFSVENHIETRYRITFPDYVGKIGAYRNLFGYIMKNDDNVCDTSDFIDLPISHITKIYHYINDTKSIELSKLEDL